MANVTVWTSKTRRRGVLERLAPYCTAQYDFSDGRGREVFVGNAVTKVGTTGTITTPIGSGSQLAGSSGYYYADAYPDQGVSTWGRWHECVAIPTRAATASAIWHCSETTQGQAFSFWFGSDGKIRTFNYIGGHRVVASLAYYIPYRPYHLVAAWNEYVGGAPIGRWKFWVDGVLQGGGTGFATVSDGATTPVHSWGYGGGHQNGGSTTLTSTSQILYARVYDNCEQKMEAHIARLAKEALNPPTRTYFLPGPNSGLTGPNSPVVWTSKTRKPITDMTKRYKVNWNTPLSRHLTHLFLFNFGENATRIYDACGRLGAYNSYSGATETTGTYTHRGRTARTLSVDAGWYWSSVTSIIDNPCTLEMLAAPGTATWKSYLRIQDSGFAGHASTLSHQSGFWNWAFAQYAGGSNSAKALSSVNRSSVGNSRLNHVIGRGISQTSRDLWVDGVQEGTNTDDMGSTTTGREVIYTHYSASGQTSHIAKQAIYGGYALLDEEVLELTRYPWAQVIVDPKRTYFIPSGKSASPVVTWRG